MSLPSQGTSKGATRGPKVEVRDHKRRRGGVNPTLIVIGAVAVVGLVWGAVAMLGGSGDTERAGAEGRPAVPADPHEEASPDHHASAEDTGSGTGDPALDSILGTGGSKPAGSGLLSDAATRASEPADPEPTRAAPSGDPVLDIIDPVASGEPEASGAVATADGSLPAASVRLSAAEEAIETAHDLINRNELVAARDELNTALMGDGVPESDMARLREQLSELNSVLVFSPRVVPGDTMCEEYRVEAGDSLAKIARKRELATHWKLIQRVNGIDDPRRIRVGQRLKLVRGPFHAVIDKSAFRLDLYEGPPESPRDWVYVTSMPVGLGQDDGTPVGSFVVSQGKLENPGWVNPRDSRERYDRDDPKNPIGEYWIGLDGVGAAAAHKGYGIHGTIDPGSIGRTESMGCVRLRDEDIALVYEMLGEGVSVVHIVP